MASEPITQEQIAAWNRAYQNQEIGKTNDAVLAAIREGHLRGRAELAAEVQAHLEAEIANWDTIAAGLEHIGHALPPTQAAQRAALVDTLTWLTEREVARVEPDRIEPNIRCPCGHLPSLHHNGHCVVSTGCECAVQEEPDQ